MSPGEVEQNDNPFVPILIKALSPDITVRSFGWKRAFLSNYNVLHIHWPEHILRAGSRTKVAVKCFLFIALLLRNKILGVSNMRNVHNLNPHESRGKLVQTTIGAWERSCRVSVFLSETSIPVSTKRREYVTILHGDYTPFVRSLDPKPAEPTPGRILMFGLIRRYKGVEQLISAFQALPSNSDRTLRIIGAAISPEYAAELSELAHGTEGIHLDFRTQNDLELVDEILRADVIVLPYQQVYNSGAALLALSLRRRLIVTDSQTMRGLQQEVGAGWVTCVDSWSGESLSLALSIEAPADDAPNLGKRHWSSIGAEYSTLYFELASRRRGVRRLL
jgi:beta-1,4-mannosyltransferase